MLKHVMIQMLENHYTGEKAISRTIPDSLRYPFFSTSIILQLKFIHLLQKYLYKHYLHFIQHGLVDLRYKICETGPQSKTQVSRTFLYAENCLFKC